MVCQTAPAQMATKLARILRPEQPDYAYLKKVFQHTRGLLAVRPTKAEKRLPQLLTDHELVAFYEAVWQARHPQHMVMVKLLIFTGLRNAELAHVRLQDVDRAHCQIRVAQGKGNKDRRVLFPTSFQVDLDALEILRSTNILAGLVLRWRQRVPAHLCQFIETRSPGDA
jgi:integrase/recombinase XerD